MTFRQISDLPLLQTATSSLRYAFHSPLFWSTPNREVGCHEGLDGVIIQSIYKRPLTSDIKTRCQRCQAVWFQSQVPARHDGFTYKTFEEPQIAPLYPLLQSGKLKDAYLASATIYIHPKAKRLQ